MSSCVCRNTTTRALDRAQNLMRHVRVAKQQPAPLMAALLDRLFSSQVLPYLCANTEWSSLLLGNVLKWNAQQTLNEQLACG